MGAWRYLRERFLEGEVTGFEGRVPRYLGHVDPRSAAPARSRPPTRAGGHPGRSVRMRFSLDRPWPQADICLVVVAVPGPQGIEKPGRGGPSDAGRSGSTGRSRALRGQDAVTRKGRAPAPGFAREPTEKTVGPGQAPVAFFCTDPIERYCRPEACGSDEFVWRRPGRCRRVRASEPVILLGLTFYSLSLTLFPRI